MKTCSVPREVGVLPPSPRYQRTPYPYCTPPGPTRAHLAEPADRDAYRAPTRAALLAIAAVTARLATTATHTDFPKAASGLRAHGENDRQPRNAASPLTTAAASP